MKVRLLKRIRKNIIVTRLRNKYNIKVKSSVWITGATISKPTSKDNTNKAIRSITLYVANYNFKRKGRLFN